MKRFHCPILKQRTGEMSHKLLVYIYTSHLPEYKTPFTIFNFQENNYIYITLSAIIRRYCISQMIRKELPALYPCKSGVNKKDVLQQSKGHRELHIMD
jgi:hypothetical protein